VEHLKKNAHYVSIPYASLAGLPEGETLLPRFGIDIYLTHVFEFVKA
jgi:hypothetical protein